MRSSFQVRSKILQKKVTLLVANNSKVTCEFDFPPTLLLLAVRGQAFTSNQSTMSDGDRLPTLSQYQNKNDLNRIRATTAKLQFTATNPACTLSVNDLICSISNRMIPFKCELNFNGLFSYMVLWKIQRDFFQISYSFILLVCTL